MRRFFAMMLVASVATAPAVAMTRLYCRHSGDEIVDCAQRAAHEDARIDDLGCCDARVVQPLASATPAARQALVSSLWAVAIVAPVARAAAPAAFVREGRAFAIGPPPLLKTRVLLI